MQENNVNFSGSTYVEPVVKTIMILGVASIGAQNLIRAIKGKYRLVGTDPDPIALAAADLDRSIVHESYDLVQLMRIVDSEPTFKLFNFDEDWDPIINEFGGIVQDVILPDWTHLFKVQHLSLNNGMESVVTYRFNDEIMNFYYFDSDRKIQWPANLEAEGEMFVPMRTNFPFDKFQQIGFGWLVPFIEGEDEWEYEMSTHVHTWVYKQEPTHLISPGAKDFERLTKEKMALALEHAGLKAPENTIIA